MGLFDRLLTFSVLANRSKRHRIQAIVVFIVTGVISTFLFLSVTSLSILRGVSDHMIQVVVAFAWVSIFPLWIILFLLAMSLVDKFENDRKH